MWGFKRVAITAVLLSAPVWACAAGAPVAISPEMQAAAEKSAQINVTPEMKHQVEDLIEFVHSPEYQQKIKTFQNTVSQAIGVETDTSPQTAKNVTGQVYVFISSSLPKKTLRRYVREAEKVNAIVVLRGFIGGAQSVKPTLRFITDLLKKDPTCPGLTCPMYAVGVHIDPIRFVRYGIEQVPAVTFEPDEQFMGYCDEKTRGSQPDRAVIVGDMGLQYTLKTLADVQPDPRLTARIAQLEPIPWENQTKNSKN